MRGETVQLQPTGAAASRRSSGTSVSITGRRISHTGASSRSIGVIVTMTTTTISSSSSSSRGPRTTATTSSKTARYDLYTSDD